MAETSSDVALLVVSCDRYSDLWRPYFHCLFKYWSDCPYPVYLGSNVQTCPDPRVTTLAVGQDLDYSSNLLKMLETIPQKWVIATVEDRFISKTVDTPRVRRIVAAAQQNNVGYQKLIDEYPVSYEPGPIPEVGEIPKGVRYRVSFTVALWQKNVLLKLLRPGESAWDLERKGTARSDQLGEKFFAVSAHFRHDPPLTNFHSVIKGKWVRSVPEFLRREGLSDCLPKRELIPWRLELYRRAYYLRLRAFVMMRRHWWRSAEVNDPADRA